MRAVMSAHSGSSIALWSANGTLSNMFFVQSLSKDAHPPSLHWKVSIHCKPRTKTSSRFFGLPVEARRGFCAWFAMDADFPMQGRRVGVLRQGLHEKHIGQGSVRGPQR